MDGFDYERLFAMVEPWRCDWCGHFWGVCLDQHSPAYGKAEPPKDCSEGPHGKKWTLCPNCYEMFKVVMESSWFVRAQNEYRAMLKVDRDKAGL